jgi:site-specific DNA recombinase
LYYLVEMSVQGGVKSNNRYIEKIMRVGYARVSTGEQDDALTQQIARLEKAGISQLFSDVKSGKSNNRNQYNKMITLCRQGKITEIVITRIDRLARSVVTISKAIALFEEMKIKLVILDAPIGDISNPFSKFSINQMGALAQFESDLLQSRINHGYNYFREQNKACPHVPFGYKRKNECYILDSKLHESGKTISYIAREIIDWMLKNRAPIRKTIHYIWETYSIRFSATGFTNWLKNPVLRGHTRYNAKLNSNRPELWDIRRDTHTPLIDESTYQAIESLLANNRRLWGVNNVGGAGKSLLSGLVICGCCGSKCYRGKSRKERIYCKARGMYGAYYCANKSGVNSEDIVKLIDVELTKRAISIRDNLLIEDNLESPQVIELKKMLADLERLPQNEAIDDAIAKIKTQIHNHKKIPPNRDDIDSWVETLSDMRFLTNVNVIDKAEIYRKFVKSVTILSGNVIDIQLINMG